MNGGVWNDGRRGDGDNMGMITENVNDDRRGTMTEEGTLTEEGTMTEEETMAEVAEE